MGCSILNPPFQCIPVTLPYSYHKPIVMLVRYVRRRFILLESPAEAILYLQQTARAKGQGPKFKRFNKWHLQKVHDSKTTKCLEQTISVLDNGSGASLKSQRRLDVTMPTG